MKIGLNFTNAARYSFWGKGPIVYWLSKNTDGSINILTDSVIPEASTASSVYLEANIVRERVVGLDLVCSNYKHSSLADPINSVRLGLDPNKDFGLS